MNRKDSPQSVIDSYRRRQQMAPYFLGGLALLLVIVGIIILVVWFAGPGQNSVGSISLFSSATPTVTNTATATPETPTPTATITPPITVSPTETQTATPSGPYEYTGLEGENCWDIAVKLEVDFGVLLALNNFGDTCPISPGSKILIPQAGLELPTDTPVPTGGAVGQKIEYTVKFGDTLALIAARHNTTVDLIMTENQLEDVNLINAGDVLTISMNTVTATPTVPATSTVTPGGPTFTATATP